jgi:hypothetical protein
LRIVLLVVAPVGKFAHPTTLGGIFTGSVACASG